MTNIKVTTSIAKTEKQITTILLLSKQETCFLCCLRRWRFTPFLTVHLKSELCVDESTTRRVFPTCQVTVEEEEVARLDTQSVVMMKLKDGDRTIGKKALDASRLIDALHTRHQYDGEIHLSLDIWQYSPLTLSYEVRFNTVTEELDGDSLTTTASSSSGTTQTLSALSASCDSHYKQEDDSVTQTHSGRSTFSQHTEEHQESASNNLSSCDKSTSPQQREEVTELECSLRRRIPFLTKRQLEEAIEAAELLGRGTFGEVWLLMYEGELVVMKSLVPPATTVSLLQETQLLLDLDGAGGMPLALAVCLEVSALLLEYVGHTYDEFLEKCSVGGLIDSLSSIAGRLEELHDKGIVHNDLKYNNITFSGSLDSPVFHIIDCGLACHAGEVADCYLPEGDEALYPWVGPEVKRQEPVFPSHDVFSLGALIDVALRALGTDVPPQVASELQLLADACRETEPSERPSLEIVGTVLSLIKKELAVSSAHQVLSATSTSHHQQAASYTQTHWASGTSFHREVASAPNIMCTPSGSSFSHDQEPQDLDW